MKDQIILLLAGSAVGMVASYLVALWKKEAPVIEAALDGADEKIEARFDIDIPDQVQAGWHSLVHAGVAYVNKFASDARFWREVLRVIMLKDPSKAGILMAEVGSLSWDKGIAAVEAMLSPELKETVNEVKEALAVKTIAANMVSTGIIHELVAKEPEAQVRAAVRAIAPAHKPAEGPITKSKIEDLIRESIERQRKLGSAK